LREEAGLDNSPAKSRASNLKNLGHVEETIEDRSNETSRNSGCSGIRKIRQGHAYQYGNAICHERPNSLAVEEREPNHRIVGAMAFSRLVQFRLEQTERIF
jgi:hypothetical protein